MGRGRVIVVGAGHNGLVCAAYLARAGAVVTVLERRSLVGGSCVTEERWPGYRVSRAAYVLGLFRPEIIRELALARYGLRLIPRVPSSFTPLPDGRSLVLGADLAANVEEISKYSSRDARVYPEYEALLERIASAAETTFDAPPPEPRLSRLRDLRPWAKAAVAAMRLGRDAPRATQVLFGSARDFLDEWFESEPLRSTLATDAVIGAFAGPSTPGTGYVLFHHVMGSVTGNRGVWAYVAGGMGALSEAIAGAARAAGASIRTDAEIARIRTAGGRATGVVLAGGEEIDADLVVSSADPAVTFTRLMDASALPEGFARSVGAIDYRSPVFKINLALDRLPVFSVRDREGEPPLAGTIHAGTLDLESIDAAFRDAAAGRVSERPMIEMTIPSVVDPTLAPEGKHVASIFAQYAPALAMDDPQWPTLRDQLRDRVIAAIEEVSPGFAATIREIEVLAPPDLESIFGLTGGNIFHGAMTPNRLFFTRPVAGWSQYRTPVAGLYLCGAGTHPGGGVIGACGRNAAREIAAELRCANT